MSRTFRDRRPVVTATANRRDEQPRRPVETVSRNNVRAALRDWYLTIDEPIEALVDDDWDNIG